MKTRVAATAALALVLISIGVLTSCEKPKAPEQAQQAGQAAPGSNEAPPKANPDRNAYFGEEHIHTSWSMDAWLMGNRITDPDDALKYAQGKTIKHPMGYDITIDTPMDFMGVTDHSEYVGITAEANTPGSAVSKMPQAQPLILKNPNDQAEIQRAFTYLVGLNSGPPRESVYEPRGGRLHLEEERQHRGCEQPSRQVHCVLLVRVDIHAELSQPAPQHLL
jgi:opacity protein-like surface antigen